MRFSTTYTQAKSGFGQKMCLSRDHLANVRVVISDAKLITDNGTAGVIDNADAFTPEVLSYSDPYPFGFNMPSRQYSSGSKYRYGYNGQEKDDEIFQGVYTAEYWEYDSRTARRWNIDPIFYCGQSSYATFNNNPIYYADPNGLEGEPLTHKTKKGDTYSKLSKKYGVSVENLRKYNKYDDKKIPVGVDIVLNDPSSKVPSSEVVDLSNKGADVSEVNLNDYKDDDNYDEVESAKTKSGGNTLNESSAQIWSSYVNEAVKFREPDVKLNKNVLEVAADLRNTAFRVGAGGYIGAVAAAVAIESAPGVIMIMNEGSLIAQAEINVLLSNSQRIIIEGALNTMIKNLPRTVVNSAAFWKIFQAGLKQINKGKSLTLKDIEKLSKFILREIKNHSD